MKIVTANRLIDGEVVWLGHHGQWVEELAAARALGTSEDEAAALDVAAKSVSDREVVDTYALDVTVEDGVIVPVRLRERIRATGPTVRLDLGKQARPATVERVAA